MALYTKSGLLVANEFEKIIINDYGGKYYEIHPLEIMSKNIYIPEDKEWKVNSKDVDYIEYRTKPDNIKVYFQVKTVNYADYKIGFYYVSVKDVVQKAVNMSLEAFIKK